eukprot:gnl/MRDRNA2_/MRDRNA2_85741_c1_seq3.p1 gnl/MRDRNA2_/MRDRNA2_85741_c1~~gnl/MRDRNA2_/MRDRNA2_85741_c1_seq3.p1  ORF type:complete len:849 (-),score=101.43 gnl/MRDRNA2_/MRDRNA2_85741_c1_seq3:123-2459(-)
MSSSDAHQSMQNLMEDPSHGQDDEEDEDDVNIADDDLAANEIGLIKEYSGDRDEQLQSTSQSITHRRRRVSRRRRRRRVSRRRRRRRVSRRRTASTRRRRVSRRRTASTRRRGSTPAAPTVRRRRRTFWCTNSTECKNRNPKLPKCNQGLCFDLISTPPKIPGCWMVSKSGVCKNKPGFGMELWRRWDWGESRGAKTKKDFCLGGATAQNRWCGNEDIIFVFVPPDSLSGESRRRSSRGSRVLLVDLPGKVEMFPHTASTPIGHQPVWQISAAASKRESDTAYISWTEKGNTGDGTTIHLSKLSVAGNGKLIKDRAYRNYDRAGGLDTTPDGRVGFLAVKRMKQWEKEYHSKGGIGVEYGHWSNGKHRKNGGPMLVAMCELKENDLSDARPKWVVSNFWSLSQDRGNGYSNWGNYVVNFYGSNPVAGWGEVTFFSAKDTDVFGDLGDVWTVRYGTTIGTHQGNYDIAISDKKLSFTKTCEPDGKKVPDCGPTTLPDGIKMRSTKAEIRPGIPGNSKLPSGHPQQATVAMNADGVLAACSQGDARGPSCIEIHKVRGCAGGCKEPKDKGFIMSTLPVGQGVTELRGTLVPKPPGKGWIFVYGKGINYKGSYYHAYTKPPLARHVAVCIPLKGGTKPEEQCGGSGFITRPPKDTGKYKLNQNTCNKVPRGKIVSKKGQTVKSVTVKAAKLGGRDTDRYLIGYMLEQEKNSPIENWIVEVDGTCEPTYGPLPVKMPSGGNGQLWGHTMQWTTTKSGKIVSVAPNKDKEDGAMIFTHECQSC